MKHALLVIAVVLAGCGKRPPDGPHNASEARAWGQRMRLGWVAWPDVDAMIYCTRRLDDQAEQIGVPGPCWRFEAGGEPKRIFSWMSLSRPDASEPTRAPDARCRVELQEAQLVPDKRPARVYWVTPMERILLDEWSPEPSVHGDRFFTEVSFSPESKWMAVLHVAVEVGDGERIVRVDSAAIRTLPACR